MSGAMIGPSDNEKSGHMTLDEFKACRLLMVTDHQKGALLSPLFQQAFGMEVIEVSPPTSTDSLGTFSGEVERPAGPLDTLKLKASLVPPDQDGLTKPIARLASEGSFGPHPELLFVPLNQEWVGILLPGGLFVTGYAQSTRTNYQQATVSTVREAQDFFAQANSQATDTPAHAIILTHEAMTKTYRKGLLTADEVAQAFEQLRALGPAPIQASTDMRAHLNPTRQTVIRAAAQNLIDNLRRACPNCQHVGFKLVGLERGLPCSWCSRPTRAPLAERYQCPSCAYEQTIPLSTTTADPAICNFCNG